MERSQSCCNFAGKHFAYNNNSSNSNIQHANPSNLPNAVNNNTPSGRRDQRRPKTKSSSAHNLRQLMDGRLMQQAQDLQQQQLQKSDTILLHSHHHHLTHLHGVTSSRKTPLQRQKSSRIFPDELDYSADMEDDEDCDDYEPDNDDDDDDDDVVRGDNQATVVECKSHSATKPLQARAKKPPVHRTTLIIDTSLKNCSLRDSTPRPQSTMSTPSTATTPTTSPSPLYATKSFRLPSMNHKQLSLDLPHSPSPSLTMFMQQHQTHYRHNSLGTPDTGTPPFALRRHHFGQLKRGNSLQSDSSHYSSVDSLLESRKPDPEAILINLGFGPAGTEDILSRIPKRFLKPSQVRGIDTEAFVKRLQLASSLADHSVLGYRGLTGNPDIPPSSIVAKIMQRFEVNERKKSMGSIETHMR